MGIGRVISSPRLHRRLRWVGLALGAAAVVALLVIFLPQGKLFPNHFSARPVQTVRRVRTVPLTAPERQAVDSVLDRFIPAAVGRHDPSVAWNLATPSLRRGSSRADWIRGNLPVQPYPVRPGPDHDWFLLYSLPNVVSVELGLRPAHGSGVGNAAFVVTLKRIRGRWLVDGIYLRAIYPPSPGSG
jgi:hypothetical protein